MASVDDIKKVHETYSRLFNTRDGQIVLDDLRRRFYDAPMSGADLNREVGRRDVLLLINSLVK